MLRSSLILAVAFIFTGPALASTFTVETATPVAENERIIAEKVVWSCEGTTCVAELDRKKVSVRSCKRIAKKVGEITAFTNVKSALTAEEIATCNEAAKR